MLRKLFNGVVFGTGFGIAFVAIWVIAIYFILPSVLESRFEKEIVESNKHIVDEAPLLSNSGRFLGSSGSYSGGFLDNKSGELSSGQGVIEGEALVNGQPLKGFKLRLALNGSVLSQWAVTDENGIYRVSVPYGEYRIDGYELDYFVANKVLPNKIEHPENRNSTNQFQVVEGQKGSGLKFRFVDPIVKKSDKSQYSKNEKVTLKWEPYPEAAEYTVQVYEKADANSWKSSNLFIWPMRPKVALTELDLSQYEIELKPGYFYAFEVEARNSKGSLLSNTNREHFEFDFEIVE
ncbi:hypothetical protein OAG1_10880 [Agarivorans sp. OAG1]|uniref:carboxypeptidase-like regulatory domain-containing protein n=1 Tax=Agarivorans sp. OAG1 TaxID=3082387 RepID=UPI002B2E0BF6|nr:hypothetical protein OAG1_10880 [Agarivorans sp. OAG1]